MMATRVLMVLLAFVACACVGQNGQPPSDTGTDTTAGVAGPTSTEAGADTTVAETTTTLVDRGADTEELDPVVRAELDELIVLTQELRDLAFLEPPDFDVVTTTELAERVRESVEEELEDVEIDTAVYVLLGLLEEDVDLAGIFTDLLSEQVAGFYDLETRELVVPMRSDTFSALERSTIVHELTHSLTDQHFGIAARSELLSEEERYDEAAAFLALIEGDAVVTELGYLQTLPLADQRDILEESLAIDSTAREAAPEFLVESLLFPYVEGPLFVQRLIELEGREGVDAAYDEPPVSTEQIFSPQDYPDDTPVDVSLPEVELEGYELEEESVWGELGLELMLGQVLGERTEAVNGWGGDEYGVWWNGEEAVFALAYAGDDPADVEELRAALVEYAGVVQEAEGVAGDDGAVTFADDDMMWVGVIGDRLHFVAADDPDTGGLLVEQLLGG